MFAHRYQLFQFQAIDQNMISSQNDVYTVQGFFHGAISWESGEYVSVLMHMYADEFHGDTIKHIHNEYFAMVYRFIQRFSYEPTYFTLFQ